MKPDIVVERIDNYTYSFSKSTRDGIRHVASALTYKNPNKYAEDPHIRKFDQSHLTFRRGMIQPLLNYAKRKKIPIEVKDYEYSFPAGIQVDDRMQGKYFYQEEAVRAFYGRRFGILQVPTRGGKTFIAAEILRIFLASDTGNFLFITDNTTLFTQAVNDFKRYFERYGGVEVGEIREGHVDVSKRVTVAMIQTIQVAFSPRNRDKNKLRSLAEYMRTLKFLCVDEVHDNCSIARIRIYKRCRMLEYLLCLSATPYRDDKLVDNLRLLEWSGGVIYKIGEEVLVDAGVLSEYRAYMLYLNHEMQDYYNENLNYAECKKAMLYNSKVRNRALIKVINLMRSLKIKTLVIFQSIEHGHKIASMTKDTFISGETSAEEREEAKRKFLEKKGGVLIASDIFKKGVTLPAARCVIIADGGLDSSITIQRKGRVLGAVEGKTRSIVIDFFDYCDLYFSKHSTARMETYVKSIGEDSVRILDTAVTGWIKELKKDVEQWFAQEETNQSKTTSTL